MKVVFFGTPLFAAHVLEYLWAHEVNVVAVITKPDKPKGRSGTCSPTPVKQWVLAHCPSLPIFQPEVVSTPEFAHILSNFNADLFVVVAFGEIIKQHLLDMPRLGCINLHASLLPKYRGAAPIQRCIIEGEKESGVTIMHMVKKMDAGDIIQSVHVPIGENMTFGELEAELCHVGSMALWKVIKDFEKEVVHRIPQDHSQATIAPKIELEDCKINWNLPAARVHNLIRGVNPYPGAWCNVKIRGKLMRLKIHTSRLIEGIKTIPGKLLSEDKKGVVVSCQENAVRLLEIQLEGKKSMMAEEMMRGIPHTEFSIEKD